MEPGCPSGGGGYPLSGAPRGSGSGSGRGRGVAVAGPGCPGEQEDPSGGRDRRVVGDPWRVQGAKGRGSARTPSQCVPTEKYHVKQSAASRL